MKRYNVRIKYGDPIIQKKMATAKFVTYGQSRSDAITRSMVRFRKIYPWATQVTVTDAS